MNEEFSKFSPAHSKVSKLRHWWDPFVQSRKCMSLKFTEELCHGNDEWRKNWRGIKTDMRNLTNFDPSTHKISKNLHFTGLPLTKVYIVWAKKVPRSYVWWQCRLMQNLKENWFVLSKITWAIWKIFARELESLEIGTLMGFFYQKLENIWA